MGQKKKRNIDGGIDLAGLGSDRGREKSFITEVLFSAWSLGDVLITCFLVTPSLTFVALMV